MTVPVKKTCSYKFKNDSPMPKTTPWWWIQRRVVLSGVLGTSKFFCLTVVVDFPVATTLSSRLAIYTNKSLSRHVYWDQATLFEEKKTVERNPWQCPLKWKMWILKRLKLALLHQHLLQRWLSVVVTLWCHRIRSGVTTTIYTELTSSWLC
jgi:hypothetical protein